MGRWEELFNSKITGAEDALGVVKSGDDIAVAMCASEPEGCLAVLHGIAGRVENVRVFSTLTLKPYEFFSRPDMRGRFELCSWFHGAPARKAAAGGTGTVTYVPNMLHRSALDRLSVKRPDVFIGSCTPPDRHGYVSLSTSIVYERDFIETAGTVILEVNPRLPRTFGDTHIHVRDVACFVRSDHPVPALPAAEPSTVDLAIGAHIAELVPDGATIQLGIGGIPNAAALALKGKRDLGVHTEMLVDSMMDLYEQGVITNRRKALCKDKMVAAFAMGTERLYEWLDENMAVEMRRGSWVNDPAVVRRNSKMISINTCLMVDLTGQVASESIGSSQYSGTGGQTDTAVGGKECHDGEGKSVIACASTAKGGSMTSIVPVLPAGAAVTLHRSNCDHVVTEHGVAYMRGRTVRERAQNLIAVAHPDYRGALKAEARRLGYL